MYSIVLMMALSSGADAPACHRSCDGCSGCTVAACSGCHGGGLFSGCHGGCHGGLFSGCHGGGYSCSSACSGCHSASSGCHSACSGCHGSRGGLFHRRNCHGSESCYCSGTVVVPACSGCTAPAPVKPMPEPIKEAPKQKTAISAPATIVVSLPAEANC